MNILDYTGGKSYVEHMPILYNKGWYSLTWNNETVIVWTLNSKKSSMIRLRPENTETLDLIWRSHGI